MFISDSNVATFTARELGMMNEGITDGMTGDLSGAVVPGTWYLVQQQQQQQYCCRIVLSLSSDWADRGPEEREIGRVADNGGLDKKEKTEKKTDGNERKPARPVG